MGTNDTTNWERRLKGEVIPLTSDMEPDYGFYRVRTKDRTSWRAVGYAYDPHGKLLCWLDGRPLDAERGRAIWSWASENAISEKLYRAVVDHREPWPDINPVVTQVNNASNEAPDDNSFVAVRERIDDLAREAERLMKKGAAKTQADADQAANVANALNDYWKKADNLRKVEKQPHLDAERAVEAKWKPLLGSASIYLDLKRIVCAPWLAIKKREKDEEERRAREAAENARRAAATAQVEAVKKTAEAEKTGDVAAIAEAGLAQERANEATQTAVAAAQTAHAVASGTVTAGTTGRRGVHLRADDKFEIEDRAAMFAYLATNEKAVEDIDKAMLVHAKRLHKAGIKVAGLKVTKEDMAA